MNNSHPESASPARTEWPDPIPASRVLVAIPTLNEEAHVESCIRSLMTDPWLGDARVVVADGGSTDATREVVLDLMKEIPALRLIDNPNRLQSAAINQVASECAAEDTEVLVRCDAHAIYSPRFVFRVVQSLADRPNAASIVTSMDATGSGCFQRAAAFVVDTPFGSGGSAHRGGRRSGWVDHGHHAGFRLECFRHVGGYDESFSHNEDAELDHRLTRAGGRIFLDSEIRIDYRMRSDAVALSRQYWRYGRGRARTLAKHRMRPRLRWLIPALNFLALVACGLGALVIPLLAVVPLGYASLLVILSLAAAWRMRSACGLWAGVALAVMHNFWGAGFLWQLIAR